MGRIFLKRGRWHLDFLDETGRRKRMATEYSSEEEALAKDVLTKAEAGIVIRKRALERGGPMTLRAWAARWIAERKASGGSWHNQESELKHHILPALGGMLLDEIKPRHVIEWLASMKKKDLSPSRVRDCYSTLKVAYREAMIKELATSSPCILTRSDVPSKEDKDPAWRATAIFTRSEAELLISDERISESRRVQYAILFLAGLRFGELAALRWSDYDQTTEPLGRLSIERSYSQLLRRLKPTKTNCPRYVPVHPELAKILAEWKLGGFERCIGRRPKADDLILPAVRVNRTHHHGEHREARIEYKKMKTEFKSLGIRHRRQHDARRTFISLALSDGALPHILKWITHGSKLSVMDQYTTLPWPTLCSAVSCVKLKRREGQVIQITKVASGTTLAPPDNKAFISSSFMQGDHSLPVANLSTYASHGRSENGTLDGEEMSMTRIVHPSPLGVVPNGAKPGDPVGDTLMKILAEWRERRDPLHLRASIRALAKVLRNSH